MATAVERCGLVGWSRGSRPGPSKTLKLYSFNKFGTLPPAKRTCPREGVSHPTQCPIQQRSTKRCINDWPWRKRQSSIKVSPSFVDLRSMEAGQTEARHHVCETSTWKPRTSPGGRLSIIWSSTVLPFNGCLERTRASQGSSASATIKLLQVSS